MKNSELKFIVVEDDVATRNSVLEHLAREGFVPTNKLGVAGTYDEAKDLLQKCASDVDAVFLDLNIPLGERDPGPDDKNGKALLDLIHDDFNKRTGVGIGVVIISGQDLAVDEVPRSLLLERYKPTLLSIVKKEELTRMLKSSLKQLRRDLILAGLERLNIPLTAEWNTLQDHFRLTLERLSAGRHIAIRISQNEIDHYEKKRRAQPGLDDNLGGIYQHLLKRFKPDTIGAMPKPTAESIQTAEGWDGFLWRGTLLEHFRTINTYWNAYKHLSERPYQQPGAVPSDKWRIPPTLIERGNHGQLAAQIVELAVRDLLEWYLPWHEQVLAAP